VGLGPVITSKSNIWFLLGVGPGKAALGSTKDQKRESRQLGVAASGWCENASVRPPVCTSGDKIDGSIGGARRA
jgi:hypothetical protein